MRLAVVGSTKVCTGKGKARHCAAKRHALGALAVAGHAGPNAVRFAGRLHGRPLAPGPYLLNVRPVAGTAIGAAAHLTLVILK